MDKYEYKHLIEQIQELIDKGEYADAAAIADKIDWRRVRSVMMLGTISDLYKINCRYEDARDVMLLAYDRKPENRQICYSLCELYIKTGEPVEAAEFYKEFEKLAPKDPGRYVLKYKLYDAYDVSLDEKIEVLEKLKAEDYQEKWMYELANLYHKRGLGTKCVEVCDELILWFGSGKYVNMAMELKMLHEPLTPEQQKKYDNRFETEMQEQNQEPYHEQYHEQEAEQNVITDQRTIVIPTTGGNESKPNHAWNENAKQESPEKLGETRIFNPEEVRRQLKEQGSDPDDFDIQVKTVDIGQYNTMNLQAELAEGLKAILEKQDDDQEEQHPTFDTRVMPSLTQSDSGPLDLPVMEEADEEDLDAELEEKDPAEVDQKTETEETVSEEPVQEAKVTGGMYQDENGYFHDASELQVKKGETKSSLEKEAMKAQPPEAMAKVLTQEADGQLKLVIPEKKHLEKQITGQLSIEDIRAEWEKMKQESQAKQEEEVHQQVLRQTGRMFTEFEEAIRDNILKQMGEEIDPNTLTKTWQDPDQEEENEEPKSEWDMDGIGGDHGTASSGFFASLTRNAEKAEEAIEAVDEVAETAEEAVEKAEEVAEVAEDVVEKAEEAAEEVAEVAEDVVEKAEEAAEEVAEKTEEKAEEAVGEAEEVSEAAKEVTEEVAEVVEEVAEAAEEKAEEAVEEAAEEKAEEAVEEVAETAEEKAEEAVEEVAGAAEEIAEVAEDIVENAEEAVEEIAESAEEKVEEAVEDVEESAETAEEKSEEVVETVEEMAEKTEEKAEEAEDATPTVEALAAAAVAATSTVAATASATTSAAEPEKKTLGDIFRDDFAWGEEALEEEFEEASKRRNMFGVKENAAVVEDDGGIDFESLAEEETVEETEAEPVKEERRFRVDEEFPIDEEFVRDDQKRDFFGRSVDDEDLNDQDTDDKGFIDADEEDAKEADAKAVTETDEEKEAKKESSEEASKESKVDAADKPAKTVRDLTEEEEATFDPWIRDESDKEQFANAIDGISMAAYTGNVIITGDTGLDIVDLTKAMIREVKMSDSNFSGKVAKIPGAALNKKDVGQLLDGLKNGALIVENASAMGDKAVGDLRKILQREDWGIIVFLLDTRKNVKKFLKAHENLKTMFNVRIDVQPMSNDALAEFARQYAKDQEYSIDNLGMLALHMKIDEMQSARHAVNTEDVKELMDDAIYSASRKTLGHFFDIIFGRRYDEEDMIIITEKDFS